MSSSGPLTPSKRARSRAPQEAKWDSCFFGKGPGHPRLESTDALKQRIRFDRSTVVSQSLLDHFTNTPVAFCSLFVVAEPLLLQTRIFAPTCVIFSAQGIVCPPTFKVAFGERVVLVQKVLSKPFSKPAAKEPTMHSFTISSRSFMLAAKRHMSSALSNAREVDVVHFPIDVSVFCFSTQHPGSPRHDQKQPQTLQATLRETPLERDAFVTGDPRQADSNVALV